MKHLLLAFLLIGSTLCFSHSLLDCSGGPETFQPARAFELLLDWYTPVWDSCFIEEAVPFPCIVGYTHPGWQSHGWAEAAAETCMDVPEFSLSPGEVEFVRVRVWDAAGNSSDLPCPVP